MNQLDLEQKRYGKVLRMAIRVNKNLPVEKDWRSIVTAYTYKHADRHLFRKHKIGSIYKNEPEKSS